MLTLSEMHYVDGVTAAEQKTLAGYERLVGSAFTVIEEPGQSGTPINEPQLTMLTPSIAGATAWRRLLLELRRFGLGTPFHRHPADARRKPITR